MQKTEILAEINRLLEQQSESIQGKLGPVEVMEYASPSARIRELFARLNERLDLSIE